MATKLQKAQGCLMGLISGDNLGALVEFQKKPAIAKVYPDGFHNLQDGGTFNLRKGQPTDDGEMALTLARSIIAEKGLKKTKVLSAYKTWSRSNPFDIGNTIGHSLWNNDIDEYSASNGALMRIAPVGIYGASLNDLEKVGKLAVKDASCTHNNDIAFEVNQIYAKAIALAIQTEDITATVLYEKMLSWATLDEVIDRMKKAKTKMPSKMDTVTKGYCLVAFQATLYQLLHTSDIRQALSDIISEGGDTDTNAAIAGALFGALYGIESIPKQWQEAVLSCESKEGTATEHPRPEIYWPTDVLEIAEQLLLI
jgi:ADP-ribosyl-[dinitrogen reductase] hydrolase